MALHNNLKLFYLLHFFFSLLLPCHSAQLEVSPSQSRSPSPSFGPAPSASSSPGPAPGPTGGSRPSPGPSPSSGPSTDNYMDDDTDTQQNGISLPPSFSDSPSPSMAPSADAPSDSDTLIQFDFSPTLAPSADVDPQVKKICDSTDYPSLCLATVAPFLDEETDIPSILDVAIQAGAQFSKYGQATAQKLARNPGNPPQLASIFDECKGSFENAVENYAKASNALPEQDKGTVNSMLSAVITYVGDCQDTISKDSELYSISDRVMNMTSNCLAISSLMN